MTARTLHRAIGLALLLPFVGWAATGLVFFLKPGYSAAYEPLAPKTYPLDRELRVAPEPAWLEYRRLRTVLGEHLLARTAGGWTHLEPAGKKLRPAPTEGELRRLLADAIAANPARYGRIAAVSGDKARTDTGVEVALDWSTLSLSQRGKDTDRIDRLYRIHYLQWTGIKAVDRVLGAAGLILVLALSGLGLRLALRE